MYCITASVGLIFPYFIEEGDNIIIDETMPLLNGDLVLLQSANRKEVNFNFDLMAIKGGVTAHVIRTVTKPCKDSDRG